MTEDPHSLCLSCPDLLVPTGGTSALRPTRACPGLLRTFCPLLSITFTLRSPGHLKFSTKTELGLITFRELS